MNSEASDGARESTCWLIHAAEEQQVQVLEHLQVLWLFRMDRESVTAFFHALTTNMYESQTNLLPETARKESQSWFKVWFIDAVPLTVVKTKRSKTKYNRNVQVDIASLANA